MKREKAGKGSGMDAYGAEFEFEGLPVGLFKAGQFPLAPGNYPYEPFRGPGHYEMATALRDGRTPRCSYADKGQRISFSVLACSQHSILALDHFEMRQDDGHPPVTNDRFARGESCDE